LVVSEQPPKAHFLPRFGKAAPCQFPVVANDQRLTTND
jgi:hypothetical protein